MVFNNSLLTVQKHAIYVTRVQSDSLSPEGGGRTPTYYSNLYPSREKKRVNVIRFALFMNEPRI